MCLPLVAHIKEKHPHANITWLCGQSVYSLLKCFRAIDECVPVDDRKLLTGSSLDKISAILACHKKLAGRSFDLGLYYYHSKSYQSLLLTAKVKTWRGFNKMGKAQAAPIPFRHHSHEYIRVFENFEGSFELKPQYPEFEIDSAKDIEPFSPKRIALSCGGAKNLLRDDDLRRWPISHYVQLAKNLIEAGYEVVLTGAPTDAWILPHFEGLNLTNKVGKYNLPEYIRFLSACRLLVTHDSGPLHMADLANCPVLGLFGPTIPQEKCSLQVKSRFLWGGEHLACRPCYDGRNYASCKDNLCLKTLRPEVVYQTVQEMLMA